jgi:hypothetical protein
MEMSIPEFKNSYEQRCIHAKAIYRMRYDKMNTWKRGHPDRYIHLIALDDLEKSCLSLEESELLGKIKGCRDLMLKQDGDAKACSRYYWEFRSQFCKSDAVEDELSQIESSVYKKFSEANPADACAHAKAIFSMRYSRNFYCAKSKLFKISLEDLENNCSTWGEKALIKKIKQTKDECMSKLSCHRPYEEFHGRFCKTPKVESLLEEMQDAVFEEYFDEARYLYY